MTDEDRDMANAALLLDEKIEERLRRALQTAAVSSAFPGFRMDLAQSAELRNAMFMVAYEVCASMVIDLNAQMRAKFGTPMPAYHSPNYLGHYAPVSMPYSYGPVTSVAQLPRLVF